jgi:hypothetical protein
MVIIDRTRRRRHKALSTRTRYQDSSLRILLPVLVGIVVGVVPDVALVDRTLNTRALTISADAG